MFSLESMLSIPGDMEYADLLEKITYNALPTQAPDDFSSRQYFQAANFFGYAWPRLFTGTSKGKIQEKNFQA